MFKSVADRLGFPHSSHNHHSNSSSGATSPSPSPSTSRTSLFSSSSSRSPSRQQQHRTYAPTTTTSSFAGPTAAQRKASAATPKPVLPPLTFYNSNDYSLATSVANAGTHPAEEGVPGKTENVTVSVRVRPFSPSEARVAGGPAKVWAIHDACTISYAEDYTLAARRTPVDYTYDHALTGSDNELIYNTSVKDLVKSAMEGYNGTVFAYGQTSSGKTYTMSGTEKEAGIIPRAVEDVFKYIRENGDREFLLRVSYLEIYNESIRDLLSPEAIDLRIHEDKRRGVYVSPLKEEIVTTPSQVMRIIARGDYQRHVSSTDYNAHSSRSHSIFQIVIESRERAPAVPGSPTARKKSLPGSKTPKAVRVSQLNLIDLAGSEKASSDIERRKEGAFINKSLLTLGTVIAKLTDEKGSHIPFRDSKLTRILQSSLSGNARVSVICTVSPSSLNVEESHNTLKFAARVKKVVTKAHTNQVLDDKALLEKYRREITELRAQLLLTAASSASGGSAAGSTLGVGIQQSELSSLLAKERLRHEEEMVEMNMVRNALKERIDHLTKLILTSQSINSKASPDPPSGRYTVETSADGTVLEFPKEIESRLARKDTIVRQLQNELEAQQEKVTLMRNALQKTAKGEVVDIEKTLARLEMEPQPREKFLIEKRASIMNFNTLLVHQEGGGGPRSGAAGTGQGDGSSSLSKDVEADSLPKNHPSRDDSSFSGERLAIDDEEEDEDLMDTPWNRAELQSLRQAKRELEIVVIDQEKKLEDMVAFEDSDEFRNLVIEMEEQREKIIQLEEEREGFKATITELRNTIRKMEMRQAEHELERGGGGGSGMVTTAIAAVGQSAPSSKATSPPSSLPSSPLFSATRTRGISITAATARGAAVVSESKVQDLEVQLQRERRLRLEEQQRNMGRIASFEAELTVMKAELSVRHEE